MHTFEISGLGKAPFTYIQPTTKDIQEASGVFWCQHCGTQIKNRHFVRSEDSQTNVVGVDCLKKTGDQGLIAGELRLRKQLRAEEREKQRAAIASSKEGNERALFNGLTRNEAIEQIEESIKTFKSEFKNEIEDHEVLAGLTRPGFEADMVEHAMKIRAFSKGQLAVLIKIYAKRLSNGARANSKAFNAVKDNASEIVDNLQSKLTKAANDLEELNKKRIHIFTA